MVRLGLNTLYVCMYYVNMILEQQIDTLQHCSPSSARYVCMHVTVLVCIIQVFNLT